MRLSALVRPARTMGRSVSGDVVEPASAARFAAVASVLDRLASFFPFSYYVPWCLFSIFDFGVLYLFVCWGLGFGYSSSFYTVPPV